MQSFDGWVMVAQYSDGELLRTEIEAIDLDHQDAPLCDNPHKVARSAAYQLASPASVDLLCRECVQKLVDGASGYVMGKLPS